MFMVGVVSFRSPAKRGKSPKRRSSRSPQYRERRSRSRSKSFDERRWVFFVFFVQIQGVSRRSGADLLTYFVQARVSRG